MPDYNLQFFAEEPVENGGDKNEPPTPEEKTFTQADIDRLVKERLDRERKKYADYDDLKKAREELEKIRQGEMSEVEKLKAEHEKILAEKTELEARALALETGRLKEKLLSAAGLPLELADRLKGANEDEIKADLEEVKKLFKPTSIGGPSNPGTQKEESDEARGKRMAEERAKKQAPQEGFNPWG